MSNEDTIFHKIIRGEFPVEKVFENEEMIAIRDINPQAPTHILFIPKQTLPSLREANDDHAALLGRMLVEISKFAQKIGLDENGYRVVINAGSDGGQTVFQLHMHLLGGREFNWPPG